MKNDHIQINGIDINENSPIYDILSTNIRVKTRPSVQEFEESWSEQMKIAHMKIKSISRKIDGYDAYPKYKPSEKNDIILTLKIKQMIRQKIIHSGG